MKVTDNSIIYVKRKPRKCKICSGSVVKVMYGYPTHEAFQASERGEIILVGCCLPEDVHENADWACTNCGQPYRRSLPPLISIIC